MQRLFMLLDNMGCHADEDTQHLEQARIGSSRAIRGILESRRCCECEYEDWYVKEATDPLPAPLTVKGTVNETTNSLPKVRQAADQVGMRMWARAASPFMAPCCLGGSLCAGNLVCVRHPLPPL